MTSMQPTFRRTATGPLLMTFKLRDEQNSHSCAWCTLTHSLTHARTQVRTREVKVVWSKHRDASKI